MVTRICRILGLLGFLTACASALPDIPGVFYQFLLSKPPALSVCTDLTEEFAAQLTLHIDNVILRSTEGQCTASLSTGRQSPRAVAGFSVVVAERRITVQVTEYGAFGMAATSERTRNLAAQIVAAIQAKFPDSDVREIHPKYGLFGP
jgi:hypothetical protein